MNKTVKMLLVVSLTMAFAAYLYLGNNNKPNEPTTSEASVSEAPAAETPSKEQNQTALPNKE